MTCIILKTEFYLHLMMVIKTFKKKGMEKILKNNLNSIIFICPKLVKENNPYYLNEQDLKEISKYKNIEIGISFK